MSPETPFRLPGHFLLLESTHRLLLRLARDLMSMASRRIGESGSFHLALSGGTSPKDLFRILRSEPEFQSFSWAQTSLWQVDERAVPPSDPQSNWRLIREELVDPLSVAAERVHPMPVLEVDGDRRYEEELRSEVGSLDFVLLGLGGDGHTASLFPHTAALEESERWVVFNDGDLVVPPRPRMTLTFAALNSARLGALLVTGSAKRSILERLAEEPHDPLVLPVCGLRNPALTWYVDAAAWPGGRTKKAEAVGPQ